MTTLGSSLRNRARNSPIWPFSHQKLPRQVDKLEMERVEKRGSILWEGRAIVGMGRVRATSSDSLDCLAGIGCGLASATTEKHWSLSFMGPRRLETLPSQTSPTCHPAPWRCAPQRRPRQTSGRPPTHLARSASQGGRRARPPD